MRSIPFSGPVHRDASCWESVQASEWSVWAEGAPGQTWMFGPPPPRKLPRRCAVSEGFNLHAGVRIGRRQWSRLEKLCRYIARPPLAKERLSLREDGQIILKLKRPWPKAAPFMAPMHCSLSGAALRPEV
ncbi:MAG: hypothetical protein ACI8RZ_002978 [Myxococcota bacterium]|jgi:hypothetical protein